MRTLPRTAALGAALFLPWLSTADAQTQARLRVLETTDLHVHMADYDYYQDKSAATLGLARTATLIERARAEAPNVLLIDNGDLIQGNPLGDYVAKERGLNPGDVHPVYKAMNLLRYDAGNIGNHEFNYGLDYLVRALSGARFPYVNANVYRDDGDADPANDKPYFTQYTLLDRTLTTEERTREDIKIGIIGFVPPQIMIWDRTNLTGKVTARDILETAQALVPQMRAQGADLVIAVPHSGLGTAVAEKLQENATYRLAGVGGIDAVLFGHSHLVFPSETFAGIDGVDIAKGKINGVPATMPGFWGSHLGVVDFRLSRRADRVWQVIESSAAALPITRREGNATVALVEPDARILAAVNEEHEATIAWMRKAVGQTDAPIHSYFALVQDDPSIQIVTNAQKEYVERLIRGTEYDGLPVLSAGAPFKAGGLPGPEYYTNIPQGEIALKNVADLYIYPNTLQAVLITGATVREWLERSAGIFYQIDANKREEQPLINPFFPAYNFDVIDGVTYQIDVSQPSRYDPRGIMASPESHRIQDLRFAGKPIDPQQKFIVVTNNYRASGGGAFPGLDGKNIIIEAPDENRTVLANYILNNKRINPSADSNWGFAPIAGNPLVTFDSAPAAEKAITGKMPIQFIGPSDKGFAKYRLLMN